MNIYAALKKDHAKVESLLNQLVLSSENGTNDWKTLITQIRDELIPHSRAEEALFYNPIRETEFGKGVIMHSYQEHAMAETDLRTLQAMKAINANWTALAKKLRSDLLHHVKEEESKVFAAGKLVFSESEAEDIAEAFEALKPQIKEQSFVGTSYDLMLNLLPEAIRGRIRSILSTPRKKSA
jgi:hemerythrin superfamily protein